MPALQQVQLDIGGTYSGDFAALLASIEPHFTHLGARGVLSVTDSTEVRIPGFPPGIFLRC
jgi:hypothetical protein